jgi:hypothetical protein
MRALQNLEKRAVGYTLRKLTRLRFVKAIVTVLC